MAAISTQRDQACTYFDIFDKCRLRPQLRSSEKQSAASRKQKASISTSLSLLDCNVQIDLDKASPKSFMVVVVLKIQLRSRGSERFELAFRVRNSKEIYIICGTRKRPVELARTNQSLNSIR